MAKKIIIKNQLKTNEVFVGEFEEVSGSFAVFTDKDENVIKIPLPKNVLDILEEDFYSGEILEIKNVNDWEVNELDEWPAAKPDKE